MRNLSVFILTISFLFILKFSYSQKNTKLSFYDYLMILPDSLYPHAIISKLSDNFNSGQKIFYESKIEYYYQQPYENITINYDERIINAFYDTINYLLLVSDNFKSYSIKVYKNNSYAIIAFSEKEETEIENIPVRTCFYKIHKNKVVDITHNVYKSLDFCSDNYSSNTLSYFDSTSYKLDCSFENLNFYFTKTDTIWVVDCLYDISEEFGLENFFNKEYIYGSDIARKYFLKRKKIKIIK